MKDEKELRGTISRNISFYRKKSGLSQKNLAEKMGVLPSRVSNWEQGINSPSLGVLVDLCEILGITLNEMFGISSKNELNQSEKELLNSYRKLDDHGRRLVKIIINAELLRTKNSSQNLP